MNRRIGLYGGSFDPIHHGHLIVARAVAEHLALDRVVFLPSGRPPHKDDRSMQDAGHRAAMVKLAIAHEPLFAFSDADLKCDGPSYTFDTVAHFHATLGAGVILHWIIGADSLSELAGWHRVAELVAACQIVTAVRPGWEQIDWAPLQRVFRPDQIEALKAGIVMTPAIDISSTDIRERLRSRRSIRYLAPQTVLDYIERFELYR